MDLKCIVVDDEPLAVEILEAYIEKLPELQHVGSFNNGLDALQFLRKNSVDFILLDIQMPEITGMQMMNIMDNPPLVIFTTAYDQYAIKSYELEAVDYLLKPVELGRFIQAVDKVKKRKGQSASQEDSPQFENSPSGHDLNSSIFIRTEHRLQRIEKSDIFYIEGMRNYLRIVCKSGKYMTLLNFKNIEEMLSGPTFVRVHKSFIVALDKIDSIENSRIRIAGAHIPIGDTYRKDIDLLLRKNISQ